MNISQRLRTCARHTGLDAVIELLNEAADEIDALQARAQVHPAQAEVTDDEQQAIDQIMEQAQVLASAWSLVGGRFDSGDALDDAIDAKEELREIVARAILALRPAAVPMTPQQALDSVGGADWGDWWPAYIAGIRAAEAHHHITAQAKKETP